MTPKLKRSLHWVGALITIVGVVFVALNLNAQVSVISHFDWTVWPTATSLAMIYGLANLPLAGAWWKLLKRFSGDPSFRWVVKVYGIYQISKYIPGNIMHMAGRQALGVAEGLAGWPLAKSAVWELGLISLSATLFVILLVPLALPNIGGGLAFLLFVLTVLLATVAASRLFGNLVACAISLYVCFLLTSGIIFLIVLGVVGTEIGTSTQLAVVVCGAFVIAWLAGLVTPGSPAGIGVRELVLLFLLKGVVGEAELLMAVVLGRLVTVMGDILFWVLSLFIFKNPKPSQ